MTFYTFGPQSLNTTTIRAAPDSQVSAGDTWFKDCTGGLLNGTQATPSWLNVITAQLNAACRGAGVNPDPSNDSALWEALQPHTTYTLPAANHVTLGGVELASTALVTAGADETTAVTPAEAYTRLEAEGCTQPPYAGYDEIPVTHSTTTSVDLSTYLGVNPTSVLLLRPPTLGTYTLTGYVLAYTAPAAAGRDKIGFVGVNAFGHGNLGSILFNIT